ncbi:cGMP-specific 3',5'-cGMP phosphodiesterase 3-like [Maniola jurtina]|uniref:cGMP-specific 3',5'-cGMP phosphodiesterase 3-like n=1 Tax=Maniola jurtina TaxID=191418 RepID=UPI001E686291|nr:cGMP-specific 3',5'-cGMP phosphodiesterase 3-like [Maniola jurtina]
MLHLFLISLLPVIFASPFQKYPYVFLLDVGNEEIGKFSTQQIRLSIPGGSLAVRYPAVGEGDTIGHVRVTGIDFGTDLKANIIQGGPGYKYAVFVFVGNPGTPYDAVVTIQTVPNMDASPPKLDISYKENVDQGLEDANDSSEDTSDNDNSITKTMYKGNRKQVMQSSSNIYHYTSNAVSDDDFNNNGVETQSEEDFHDENEDDDNDVEEDDDDYKSSERNYAKGGYSDESSDDARVVDVKSNQYGIYEAFKPHWLGGVRFYPQASLYVQDSYGKPVSDDENRDNDELSENYYKDLNNNINDFGAPVEYK